MTWDDFERVLCWMVCGAAYERGVLRMSEHQFTMWRSDLLFTLTARGTR